MTAQYRIIAVTQYRENYGDAENPHWKNKFGSDFVVREYDDVSRAQELIESGQIEADIAECRLIASEAIDHSDDYTEEWVIGCYLVEGLTEYEQFQLDQDGSIRFPASPLPQRELEDA